MITIYGGYPNVPLLGIQGAINYNPELHGRLEVIESPRATGFGSRTEKSWWNYHGGNIQHQDHGTQGYKIQEMLEVGELENAMEKMRAEQGALKRKLEIALEEVRLEK
ncbi:hypothetical protein CR513_12761, partial [Mucuna pruriens]